MTENMKQRAVAILAAVGGLLFFIALLFFFVGGTHGSAYSLSQPSGNTGVAVQESNMQR